MNRNKDFKSKHTSIWQGRLCTSLDTTEEKIDGLEKMFKNDNIAEKNKYMKHMK